MRHCDPFGRDMLHIQISFGCSVVVQITIEVFHASHSSKPSLPAKTLYAETVVRHHENTIWIELAHSHYQIFFVRLGSKWFAYPPKNVQFGWILRCRCILPFVLISHAPSHNSPVLEPNERLVRARGRTGTRTRYIRAVPTFSLDGSQTLYQARHKWSPGHPHTHSHSSEIPNMAVIRRGDKLLQAVACGVFLPICYFRQCVWAEQFERSSTVTKRWRRPLCWIYI